VNSRSTKGLCRFALILALSVMLTGIALASVRIGGGSLSANGQPLHGFSYSGPCPVELTFHWGVISTEPTSITYSFSRNDGGHSSSALTANLPGGNRSVPIPDNWRLGANTAQFANYRGWVELNIQSPNRVSQKIGFTLHCQ
jgi:hypothetical protein